MKPVQETIRHVFIDHLAFTFPISELKNLETFDGAIQFWRKYGSMPRLRDFLPGRDAFFRDVVDPETRCWVPDDAESDKIKWLSLLLFRLLHPAEGLSQIYTD